MKDTRTELNSACASISRESALWARYEMLPNRGHVYASFVGKLGAMPPERSMTVAQILDSLEKIITAEESIQLSQQKAA